MKLPSTSTRDKTHGQDFGFTFVEVLIVLALVGFISAVAVIIGIDSYARYAFRSQVDAATGLLEKARSQAINNIGGKVDEQVCHGVKFDDPSNLVLFRLSDCTTHDPAYDFKVEKSKAVDYDTITPEIIFSPLSGQIQIAEANITLTQGSKSVTITINHEGGINWQ